MNTVCSTLYFITLHSYHMHRRIHISKNGSTSFSICGNFSGKKQIAYQSSWSHDKLKSLNESTSSQDSLNKENVSMLFSISL